MNNKISFREFINTVADPKIKKDLSIVGIIGYVLAAFNLVLSIFFNILGLIDVALIAVFSLGIHFGKSRVCSVLLCLYGAVNFILSLLDTGKPSGYWILFLGISAVIRVFEANKQYTTYINTYPQGIIQDNSAPDFSNI